jgi:hypothetical protein
MRVHFINAVLLIEEKMRAGLLGIPKNGFDIFLNYRTCMQDTHSTSLQCTAQNTKYLKMIFCMYVGYINDYIRIYFKKSFFKRQWDHRWPGAKNLHSKAKACVCTSLFKQFKDART